MALLTCPDCSGMVSSRAPACPHCGCPIDATGLERLAEPPPPAAETSPNPSIPLEILTQGGLSTIPLGDSPAEEG